VTEPEDQSPYDDELGEYLKLPQIPNTGELSGLKSWATNKKRFPNLARMARQYLGCPASSATVERLFSVVGIAFSGKRKSSTASTVASIAFAKLNLNSASHSPGPLSLVPLVSAHPNRSSWLAASLLEAPNCLLPPVGPHVQLGVSDLLLHG